MTVGSGLSLAPNETDSRRISAAVRQLIEGRSNAVGVVTLAHDGIETTTTVTAVNCGPNAIVILTPRTANAAAALATTYVLAADVSPGEFVITHDATSDADLTFGWLCIG